MKPIENTENFVRRGKAKVATDPQMDSHVLSDSFAAMNKTVAAGRPSLAGMILRSRTARFAAAAVVIIATSLLIFHRGSPERHDNTTVRETTLSPAEILTLGSLEIAYRQGGMEAVAKQYEEAARMRGAKPTEMSVQGFLAGLNGI